MESQSENPSSPLYPNLEGLNEVLIKDAMDVADALVIQMEETDMEDTKEIEDASDLKDHLENLIKAPIPNVLESQVNHSTKTKFTAMNIKNLATCRKIAWN